MLSYCVAHLACSYINQHFICSSYDQSQTKQTPSRVLHSTMVCLVKKFVRKLFIKRCTSPFPSTYFDPFQTNSVKSNFKLINGYNLHFFCTLSSEDWYKKWTRSCQDALLCATLQHGLHSLQFLQTAIYHLLFEKVPVSPWMKWEQKKLY